MPKEDLRTECSGEKVIVSVVSVFFVVASFHRTNRSAFLVVCCVCLRLSVCVCACALGDVYPFCRPPVGFGGGLDQVIFASGARLDGESCIRILTKVFFTGSF